eukprot:403368636
MLLKHGAEDDQEYSHSLNNQLEELDQQIEFEKEQRETQEHLYQRNLDENRQKQEQIDEMLAVVYHYADVMEKWENIKFISEKEKKEMENKYQQAINIVRKRKKENKRKIKEKMHILSTLKRMIDKFDDQSQENHMQKLQQEGKLQKLQMKAIKMEQELQDENNYLNLQTEQLKEYERQYSILCDRFKQSDLGELSKAASNVLGPQMHEKEREEAKLRNIMNQIGRLQWTKNKYLEELRENQHRWEEEKKREKEEMVEIENKMRMKSEEIQNEKLKQNKIIEETRKNTLMIYKFLDGVFTINNMIDNKVQHNQLPGEIYMSEDKDMISRFLNFREIGSQNEGFDESKKKLVIQSALFLEKKLQFLYRDASERIDLSMKDLTLEEYPLKLLQQRGSLLDKSSLAQNESPLANKSRDLQKLRTQRRATTLDMMAFEAGKLRNMAQIDKNNNEGMGTLLKDALLLKISNQALILKREISKQKLQHGDKKPSEQDLNDILEDENMTKTSRIEENQIALMKVTDKDELFGEDSYIQDNKSIRRKWQLQNISSLHKVENKFRQLNMMYTHVTKSDLELKQSKAYLERLIVNKKPGEMTAGTGTLNNTLQRQQTVDLIKIGKIGDQNKLSMISEGSSRILESQIKFEKNLQNPKQKKKRIHIPGQITQAQIQNQKKRLNSASSRQITQIINKQSQDMINSTKLESATSQTNFNYNSNTYEDGFTKNYNSGSPSITSQKRHNALQSKRDDSQIQFISDKKQKDRFVKTFNKDQLKLRPTTAYVPSTYQKHGRQMNTSIAKNTKNNNFFSNESKSQERRVALQKDGRLNSSQNTVFFNETVVQCLQALTCEKSKTQFHKSVIVSNSWSKLKAKSFGIALSKESIFC